MRTSHSKTGQKNRLVYIVHFTRRCIVCVERQKVCALIIPRGLFLSKIFFAFAFRASPVPGCHFGAVLQNQNKSHKILIIRNISVYKRLQILTVDYKRLTYG